MNGILEDRNGHIWFATHYKGVCRWDGKSFKHFTSKDGIKGTEAWKLFQDRAGNIWFPIEHAGVYRYDGQAFANFYRQQGLLSDGVQCFLEDREGRKWFGGVFGLFRYDGKTIYTVGKETPWQ